MEPTDPEIVKKIKEQGPELLQGAKETQQMMISVGLPACKFFLNTLIDHGSYPDTKKDELRRKVNELSTSDENGCMTINTTPKLLIILEPCGKVHDMDAQMTKIKSLVPEARLPEVMHFLSVVVYLGRSVYRQVVTQCTDLFNEIKSGHDPKEDFTFIRVDPNNSTLYLMPDWNERIGIKAYTENDLPQPPDD